MVGDKYGDFLLGEFEEYKTLNQQLTCRLAHLETENKFINADLDTYKKKCLLYRKERDCYRHFIKSYESEINGEKYFDLSKEAFTKLDDNLAHYSSLAESFEGQLNEVNLKLVKINGEYEKFKDENGKLREALSTAIDNEKELRAKLVEMKEKCQKLESEINDLKAREQSEPRQQEKWRIIHLKDNPVDNRITQDWRDYQALKVENERLKARLEIIQAGHNADITRIVNEEINYNSEIENLKMALQSSEMKRFKLIEEFKRTSKDYREAINCLTGLRIDIKSDNVYRVSFLHGQNPSDYLLFKAENKDVELLENDFSRNLTDFIQLYLVKYDSYPAFLAAVSLDLFKKWNLE